ncbi:P-selectin-like [Ruditapes philippinarum]|uniref:P-selectin-like n=1 Tax=Ruditapes philippinarum TaxID=129788 RepID=UPI00295C2242|nr:P-selectin-like [Ruditapes philippinarum]
MTTFASKAEYICDNGYQLNGSDTIECKDTGEWSDHTTYCQIKDCGLVSPPTNGDIVFHQNSTVYGSNATYICDEGYNMIGQANIKCEASGDWDNKTTYCKIKDCGLVSPPTNGDIVFHQNSTVYGSNATYICDEGYNMIGQANIKCEASGDWDNKTTYCKIKDCGLVSPPTNGDIVFHQNSTVYGSNATYICDEGYNMIGQANIKCEASGDWDNKTTYCKIKDCGPRTPRNGSVELSNGTSYQSLMTFKCDEGFDMNGTKTSVCQANSKWSHEVPQCIIKDCGEPKWPNQGKILSKTGNKYNDYVTYSCNQGYETSDPVLVTCNSSGNWSRPAPVCKDINECTRYTNDCHLQAICNNTDGTFTCQCREGFTDNSTNGQQGRDCQDINECADLKKIQCYKDRSRCVNYLGGYVCFCHEQFPKRNMDDIDYVPDIPLRRASMDKSCNSFGVKVLDLCKANNLRIVNGRLFNDMSGSDVLQERNLDAESFCSSHDFNNLDCCFEELDKTITVQEIYNAAKELKKGKSPQELQMHLDKLYEYCKSWGLEVNIDKTKIVVFRKRGGLLGNEFWTYDGVVCI